MKFLFTALILFISQTACQASELRTHLGTNEIIGTLKGRVVTIHIKVVSTKELSCHGWWGSYDVCPRVNVGDIFVSVGKEELSVPRSAYGDLGNPNSVKFELRENGFHLEIKGADAGESYTATLRFSEFALESRRVESDSFPNDAWEQTQYQFNDYVERQ